MKCIKIDKEEDKIKEFIKLPIKIYSRKDNMEDKKEIEKLLKGIHPLSKYFSLDKFLIY